MKALRPTEAQCQSTIIEAAQRLGYLVHAERPAIRQSGAWSTPIQGDAGFPDLVLVHPRSTRLVFVELKRKPNRATPEQDVWLHCLNKAGVHAELVYVPEGMDDFIGRLKTWAQVAA